MHRLAKIHNTYATDDDDDDDDGDSWTDATLSIIATVSVSTVG